MVRPGAVTRGAAALLATSSVALATGCIGTTTEQRAIDAADIETECDERGVETKAVQTGDQCIHEYYYWEVYCADKPHKRERVACKYQELFCHQPKGFCFE